MIALAAVVAMLAPADLDAGVLEEPDAYAMPATNARVYEDAAETAREIRELIDRIRRRMEDT